MNGDDVAIIDYDRVSRFARVLDQAVHDAQHELVGDGRVIHFWDDDSLNLPLQGYRALGNSFQRPENRLVQALFSADFLGPVSLLRPHRSELLGLIATWESRRDQAQDRDLQVERLLLQPNVQQVLDLTEEIQRRGTDLSMDDLSVILGLLRQIDAQAFVTIESLAGGWRDRLNRLAGGRLIDFQPYGPSLADLYSTPTFARITEDLSGRSARPLATAIDAAALTALIAMNGAARDNGVQVYPRFFTSSETIRAYYRRNPWLQDQLSYGAHGTRWKGTVWRDSAYYMLRATFPELRLNARESRASGDPLPALAELQDLASRLNQALDSSESEVRELVQDQVFTSARRRVRLGDLIDELENSRMSRLWLNYQGARLPDILLKSLAGIRQIGADARAQTALETYEQDIEDQILQGAIDYRISISTVEAVDSAIRQLAQALNRVVLTVTSDLASVRWGIEYDDDDARNLIGLRPGNEGVNYGEILRVFDLDNLRQNPDETLRTMAILLGLEEFDLADEVITRVEQSNSSATHWLMSTVAILGGRRPLSERQLELTVTLIQSQWARLETAEQDRLVLGYAYAVFAAWTRSAFGGAWSPPRDDQRWAAWTLEIVQDRIGGLGPLPFIYAVNHLVYVAARLDVVLNNGDELLSNLELLVERVDEYRFLDTVGFALLRKADRTADESESREYRERATRYLERASAIVPEDLEVRQHLELARKLSDN